MFPGMKMNPGQMQKALKQMGISTKEVDAEQVIIKGKSGRDIVIDRPVVTEVNMQGVRTFQVVGEVKETTISGGEKYSEDDVKLVAEQANVPEEEAEEALKKTDGDIAGAILLLKESLQ